MPTRLAVLGSPIAHSLSPALHSAAYRVLGLDWEYGIEEVTEGELAGFLGSRDAEWRGLSLTMPLKRDVLPLLDERDRLVVETGSANTVLLTDGRRRGYNTDVYGITESFRRHGRGSLDTVLLLGGGATAASALAAAAQLGATRAFVAVRSPERAARLADLGIARGIEVDIRSLDRLDRLDERLDAVISTLPNGADAGVAFDPDTTRTATLFDVGYHPWPTALAAAWTGESVIRGLEMLVLQALQQVRVFVAGDPERALPEEDAVLAAMIAAVDL